jgi:GntR family transcriptional regulator/MocR family aminotransferase
MIWHGLHNAGALQHDGKVSRYEQLANLVERVITEEGIAPGERLPTARELSKSLEVSATTVSAAFDLLTRRGLIRAEVGRGTFVQDRFRSGTQALAPELTNFRARLHAARSRSPWRRAALMSLSARLRTTYPDAVECGTGRPDPALLPFAVVRRAWSQAMDGIVPRDLQYAGPEPIDRLRGQLVDLLVKDGIAARPEDLVICSSAQQVFTLILGVIAEDWQEGTPLIAVEEPGYPTVLDTFEHAGCRMIGLNMDEYGVLPTSLEAAVAAGAQAVLFTPRGQNPTGASWSQERCAALADVLARYPKVIALEDDQVAEVASTRPGSLLNDSRIADRVVYIRSFSKSIAPDLRIAVVAARTRLLARIVDAKTFADGWTSRLLQRVLSGVLADTELESLLEQARLAYRERRQQAAEAVNKILIPAGGGTWCGPDGVNIWIHLPPGFDGRDAIERSAASGVRIADGEPFYLAPGHRNVVRLNAGSVPSEVASKVGVLLARAILESSILIRGPIHV